MQGKLESQQEKLVNFATRAESCELIIEEMSAKELASRINQPVQWSDEISVEEDLSLFCYLLHIPSDKETKNFEQIAETIVTLTEDLLGKPAIKVLVLFCNKFYFAEQLGSNLRIADIDNFGFTKENRFQLLTLFNDVKERVCQLANPKQLKILSSVLGCFLDCALMRDTIETKDIQEKLNEVKKTHQKLAIMHINPIVGYGVVALEDISVGTTISLYSGIFQRKSGEDDYTLGCQFWGISAIDNRNFAGFISHAFKKTKPEDESSDFTVYLNDFIPCKSDVTADKSEQWRTGILAANLTENTEIYNHIPYIFFINPMQIKKGEILAWDYGLSYWISRDQEPCLLTLNGRVVDPDTYLCNKDFYFERVKPVPSLSPVKTLSASSSLLEFSLFKLKNTNPIAVIAQHLDCNIL